VEERLFGVHFQSWRPKLILNFNFGIGNLLHGSDPIEIMRIDIIMFLLY
jgi:hypothetical protein